MCCIVKRSEYVKYTGLVIGGLLVEPVEGQSKCFRRIGIFESSGRAQWALNMTDNDLEFDGDEISAERLGRKHYNFFAPIIFSQPMTSIVLV
jgi:hypothetical protein